MRCSRIPGVEVIERDGRPGLDPNAVGGRTIDMPIEEKSITALVFCCMSIIWSAPFGTAFVNV